MQFIDLKAQYKTIESTVQERINAVLEHGKFILGPEVKELEQKLAEYVERSPADYVITDVRYPNEAEWVLAQGGRLWRVERTEGSLEDIGRDLNHESEVALDDFTGWERTIWNDGSLEDLYSVVDSIMNGDVG